MRRSILTEKLARRGHHITREYSIDPFELARVGDVMDPDVPSVSATMKLSELSDRIARGDSDRSLRQGALIMEDQIAPPASSRGATLFARCGEIIGKR